MVNLSISLRALALLCIVSGIANANILGGTAGLGPTAGIFGGGSPPSINGQINAINYDLGGQPSAFSTTVAGCGTPAGSSYRTDFANLDTTTDGTPWQLGCNKLGNYYKYTINVPTTQNYLFSIRVANVETGASWGISIDGVRVATITVPNTGSYTTMQTVSAAAAVPVTQGKHMLRLFVASVGASAFAGDINWITGGQSIASIALSNTTFAANTANAIVGTVAVTMAPASPAFSGTLAITGANSGGFHLVGSTLEASASGTAPGTYADLNITATQAGIANSPQSIAPSLTSFSGTLMTCPAITGPFLDVAAGADLNTVAQGNPAGTKFRLGCGTFHQTNFVNVQANQVFVGLGQEQGGIWANSCTIIDGNGVNHSFAGFYPAGAPAGVTFQGLTIQNFGGNAMIVTSDNWTLCGNTLQNSVAAGSNDCRTITTGLADPNEPNCGGAAVSIEGGGVTVKNNVITNNDENGVSGIGNLTANHNPNTITGNEICGNNVGNHDFYYDAGGIKLLINGNPWIMTYNYVHDNNSTGMWCDTVRNGATGFGQSCTYTGNTVLNNSGIGIFHEVSDNGDIGFNVVANNGIGPCYGRGNGVNPGGILTAAYCNGNSSNNSGDNMDVAAFNSSTTKIHDNNITTTGSSASVPWLNSLWVYLDGRTDVPTDDGLNLQLFNNTVTFRAGVRLYGFDNRGGDIHGNCAPSGGSYVQCTGDTSNTNTFWDTSANNSHFLWNQNGGTESTGIQTYSTYRSFTGQDAGSGSVNVGSGQVSGCMHVGCTANPVGTGGH